MARKHRETFGDVVREVVARPQPEVSTPPPPKLPRFEGEFYVGPTGTEFWETSPGSSLEDAQARELGREGAELVIDPAYEYCDPRAEEDPDDALVWFETNRVREAAERGEPICRSGTSIWLYQSMEGAGLLRVLGTGLIWPPIAR